MTIGTTRRTQRTTWTAVTAMTLLVVGALAGPAEANIGDAFSPLVIIARPNDVYVINPADNARNENLCDDAAVSGATLLASTSPGGPIIAFLTLPDCGAVVNAPPPGVYWVLLVVGHTTAHRASAADWTQLVVTNPCAGPPGQPTFRAEATGSTVQLDWNGGSGCGWDSFRLEVGTTPGGVELGLVALPGISTTFSNVPAGTYYLRVKALNRYGIGPASRELPVSVPAARCDPPRAALNGATATVVDNVVTVRWNPPPIGPAPTFYQVLVKDRFSADTGNPVITGSFIVPASVTAVSAVVPNGGYRVQILAGNACRTALPLGPDLFFNVP